MSNHDVRVEARYLFFHFIATIKSCVTTSIIQCILYARREVPPWINADTACKFVYC